MLRFDWFLLLVWAVPGRALLNPFDRILLSAVKRPQFEQRVKEHFGGAPIRYLDDASTPQATSFEIWRWADRCSAGMGETVLCLPPTCTAREVSMVPSNGLNLADGRIQEGTQMLLESHRFA
jgi:hypothetical protein